MSGYDPATDDDLASKRRTVARLRAGWTPLAKRPPPDPWRDPPARPVIGPNGIAWARDGAA